MSKAWWIVKTRYAASAFDGRVARRFGGRWSSKGVRVVYASESVALAVLEVLTHLDSSNVLTTLSHYPAVFDESLVERLDRSALPANWRVGIRRSFVMQNPTPVLRGHHLHSYRFFLHDMAPLLGR